MRLGDLDALRNEVYNMCQEYDGVQMLIGQAPTIDAVPVVRCKDCKHTREKNEHEAYYLVEDVLICTSPDVSDDCWSAVWPDHFCSYGERRDTDGKT